MTPNISDAPGLSSSNLNAGAAAGRPRAGADILVRVCQWNRDQWPGYHDVPVTDSEFKFIPRPDDYAAMMRANLNVLSTSTPGPAPLQAASVKTRRCTMLS